MADHRFGGDRRQNLEVEGILAVASLALFAGATGLVMFHLVPAENEKYAMLLLGALIGVVKDTFARYFNVTKGAAEQRQTIADMAKATADTAKVAAATTPAPGTATVTAAPDVDVSIRELGDGELPAAERIA